MTNVLASIIGYLLGSIPFALVIGKVFYNTDIRKLGSGNLGGTNAGRTLGKKAGIAVMVLDVLKAALAMLIANFIDPSSMIYAGFFATIGHCFPIFAGFRGGKAVSTAFGFLFAVSLMVTKNVPLHFLLPLLIMVVVLYITKMVSLSSMVAITAAAIIMWLSGTQLIVSLSVSAIALIVIIRHKENIGRILTNTERKITWM